MLHCVHTSMMDVVQIMHISMNVYDYTLASHQNALRTMESISIQDLGQTQVCMGMFNPIEDKHLNHELHERIITPQQMG